jgi:hypothetical protein
LEILRHLIPEGYPGTLKTAEHIASLVRQGAKDFCVRQTAIAILRQHAVQPKDYQGEIKALFGWVQRNIRYTKDPVRVEVLHSPERLLQLRAGDCDDFTILLGALLEAIGHPIRLVLSGPDARQPRLFTHVFLEVSHRGQWVPLDATMPYPMGWSPSSPVKKVIAIHRRQNMLAEDTQMVGIGSSSPVPDWLRGFILTLRNGAFQARDARVQQLWRRARPQLDSYPWLKALLLRCWKGLAQRERPKTARRALLELRAMGLWPPRRHQRFAPGPQSLTAQPLQQVVLRQVAPPWQSRHPYAPRAVQQRPMPRGRYR